MKRAYLVKSSSTPSLSAKQLKAIHAAANLLALVAKCAGCEELLEASTATGDPDAVTKLVKPKAAAAILDVSPKTLANWRTSGLGPPFSKLGGIRYGVNDLLEFAASRQVSSTSQYSSPRPTTKASAVPKAPTHSPAGPPDLGSGGVSDVG